MNAVLPPEPADPDECDRSVWKDIQPDFHSGFGSADEACSKSIRPAGMSPDSSSCGAGDERSIVEFAATELKPFGFPFVQIANTWHHGGRYDGPRRGVDRVKPDAPYPHGVKCVAEKIESLGLTAGIWFLPFARNHQRNAMRIITPPSQRIGIVTCGADKLADCLPTIAEPGFVPTEPPFTPDDHLRVDERSHGLGHGDLRQPTRDKTRARWSS